jgi:cobalamin synthase
MSMAKAKKAKAWFKPLRNSYIASNYEGALTYIPFVAYLIASLVLSLKYINSKVLAIFIAAICWIVGTLVMTAFAKIKSS